MTGPTERRVERTIRQVQALRVSKELAQLPERARSQHAHRAARQAELLGHLARGQPPDDAENEDFAVLRRELIKGALEPFKPLLASQTARRRLGTSGEEVDESRAALGVADRPVERTLPRHAVLRSVTMRAQAVSTDVLGDGREPGEPLREVLAQASISR